MEVDDTSISAGLEMVPVVPKVVGGDGSSANGGELTQNSNISVTIDDLAEGLIVVSFSHSDNLYQGVLFQLNRERGIPSGISFAKEHASHEGKCDSDPSQVTPLYQRNSYNQGNGGGGACSGIAHHHNINTVSQPSLRRIIKPPARFKNARMSLRLRARPVLCAKCRSLCDDKEDSNCGGSSKDEENSTTENQKVQKKDATHRVKLAGGKSQEHTNLGNTPTTIIERNGKLRGNEPRQACPIVEPKDLCYESVGSTKVLENYWRRPLAQPLVPSTEETYARLRKNKGSASCTTVECTRKRVKATGVNTVNAVTSATITSTVPTPPPPEKLVGAKLSTTTNSTTFLKSTNPCDKNFPNTRSRKALNLKMCISKIAEMKKGVCGGGSAKRKGGLRVASRDVVDFNNKPLDTVIKLKDHASPANILPVSPLLLQNHSDSSLESTEVTDGGNNGWSDEYRIGCGDEKVKGAHIKNPRQSTKKSKHWENRIRTKSTVPVRYRDESYLTKNIFNFNKRRPPLNSSSSSCSSSGSGGEIPVLTISRSDDESTFKVTTLVEPYPSADNTVTTSKLENSYNDNEEDDEEEEGSMLTSNIIQLSSSSSSTLPMTHPTAINMEEEDEDPSHSQSPCSSSVPTIPPQISIKTAATTSCKSATTELIKTPTIKITFGSSGNGMVVQIPPKVALGSSVGESFESISTTHLKAARKAMKKARKEAKRRRSISPSEFSPSLNALSPPPSENPDYPTKSASQSKKPTASTLKGISSVAAVVEGDKNEEPFTDGHANSGRNNLLFDDYGCNNEPSTSTRVAKKKKKQKKRRRSSKALKENDGFSTTSSNSSSTGNHVVDPTVGSTMSSPHSTFEGGCSSSPSHNNSSTSHADSSSSFSTTASDPLQQRLSFPSTTTQSPAPKRRRSMPATSTTTSSTEAPRVCINLKRIDTNAYVPLPPLQTLSSSHSDNDDPLEESSGNNGLDKDDGTELNEFPINNGDDEESPQENETDITIASEGESVDYYKDKETECCYRKGDIVWGKLPACPWWPGKIDDILSSKGEETRAKVSWYKSTTQSCVQFKMLVPFQQYFDSKYARSRRRGLYQHAVKDALVEAHKLNPQDLSYD